MSITRMKYIALASLLATSGQAWAICTTPVLTGNPAYDQFAQQQFYTCLQQQQAPQQSAYRPQGGQMNFQQLDTSIPERAAASAAQAQQIQLQNQLLRMQIEQMRRQSQ